MRLDASALSALFSDHGHDLLVFAARRTYDAELALDVVGETFATAFERRDRFRGNTQEEAVGWLFAICRTVISHHYRRRGAELRALRRLGVEVPAMGEEERDRVETAAELGTLRGRVAGALDRLPHEQREAVRLRVVEELAYADIAQRLGVAQTAVRARVSRGLRAMAQDLEIAKEARS